MAAECHVWLEEHSNVILQRVKGQMELDDYERLVQLTEECVSKMPAGTPVRILTDATNMVPPGPEVRRRAMEVMRRRKPCRMAFFGGERVASCCGDKKSCVCATWAWLATSMRPKP